MFLKKRLFKNKTKPMCKKLTSNTSKVYLFNTSPILMVDKASAPDPCRGTVTA